MAKVQLEVEIKGGDTVEKASGKVQTLRTELFKLKEQLASGQLTGVELAQAEVRAKDLTKAISETNKYIRGLASDTPLLNGFVGVAEGIVGGFTAAQGAMALFGSENEDVQKTLIKVQGAVATLNGFQAVANALQKESSAMIALSSARLKVVTFLQQRYAMVVGQTTGALKLLRIAGAALGIGLIVTAVGALVANFDKLKAVVMKFIPGMETLSKYFRIVSEAVTDFLGITSDETRALDEFRKKTEESVAQQEHNIELLRARKATAKEIYDAETKLINDQIALRMKEKKSYQDLLNQQELLRANYEQQEKEAAAKAAKEASDREKARVDKVLKQEEELFKAQQKQRVEFTDEQAAKEDEAIANRELERINKQQEREDADATWRAERAAERKKADDEAAKVQADYERQALEERKKLLTDGLGALSDITTAFAGKTEEGQRRAFAINKALNISTALIDTYMAAQKAYASQLSILTPDAPVRAQVAAGVAIASGLARVAAISATQFGSGSSGRGATGGGGAGGTPTRSQQPNVPTFTTNNNRQQTGGTEQIKVFVTETDIRNVSNRTSSIYSQAQVE